MLPLIFELLKELEDVLLIDDEGDWIYFPSDTPIDEEKAMIELEHLSIKKEMLFISE